jgi:hypothetical protein
MAARAPQRLLITFAAGAATVVAIALVVNPEKKLAELAGGLVAAIAYWCLPGRFRVPALLATAILGGVDALPGPNLTTLALGHGLVMQQAVVILTVIVALWLTRTELNATISPTFGLALLLAAGLGTLMWLVTLARTAPILGIVVSHAVSFALDLLLFPLLALALVSVMRHRERRDLTLLFLGCWSTFLAGLYSVAATAHLALTSLLHPETTNSVGGVTRIYSPEIALFSAVACVALAGALTHPRPRARQLCAVIAAVNLAAVLLSFTRAEYLSIGAALIVGSCLWLRGSGGLKAVRRLLTGVAALAVLLTLVITVFPHGSAARSLSSTLDRATSIGSTATSDQQTSTVAVRRSELALLEQRLGGSYVLGLGFLDPRDEFYPSLPFGTIRNTDVGLFNVVMTEGVVGTVIYYLPLLLALGGLVYRSRVTSEPDGWLDYGLFIALGAILGSSITLVTMFSSTGIVVVAVLVALAVARVLDAPHLHQPARRITTPRVSLHSSVRA